MESVFSNILKVVLLFGCVNGNLLAEGKSKDQVEDQIFYEQVYRYNKQLELMEEQGNRFEELLDRWEKQAVRYDAILSAWEKQTKKNNE